MFNDQGRPDFVAATTTTKFETNGCSRQCLRQQNDLTFVITSLRASIASHSRAATTLKTDAGVVGSVTHTFREHYKEADLWADTGAKGRKGWTLPDLRGQKLPVSGFWVGSCDNGNCGGSIVIMAYLNLHGWLTFYKKCGPVPRNNSLDAEMGGCGMLMDHVRQWIDKCCC